jgi:FG-GAP repeat/FG-GAP-like repeat
MKFASSRKIILGLIATLVSASVARAGPLDADIVISGLTPNVVVGFAVSGTQDLDNDSLPELFIGYKGIAQARTISGVSGEVILVLDSVTPSGSFGMQLTSLSDVNGDGVPDILVGAGGTTTVFGCWEAPKGTVFSGSTGAPLHQFTGWPACKAFPFSADGIGDFDSDGFDDILVGFPKSYINITPHGIAYIFSGKTGDTLATLMGENDFPIANRFGESVANAGDYNADGYQDFIIGAPRNSVGAIAAGRAYVFSGRNLDTLAIFTGIPPGGHLGASVDGAGDVNNDGFSDVLVADVGKVFVYSGKDNSTLYVFELPGVPRNAGDVNGDGHSDILIGQSSGRGRILLYSGKDGSLYSVIRGEANNDNFGFSLDGLGDINGDGFDDYIVGAPFNDANGNSSGRAYVFYGGRQRYLCGDVNMDNQVDSTDVTYLIDYYFHAGPPPQPFDAGNVNCSAGIDISDIIYLMMKLDNQIPNVCCPNTVSPPDRHNQYNDKPSKG